MLAAEHLLDISEGAMSILNQFIAAGEKAVSPANEKLQYSGRIDFEY